MGYSTDFSGHFNLNKPLTKKHLIYLVKFANTRRVQRNPELTEKRPDPVRKAVGLPVGPQGCYFVGETGFMGEHYGPDVIDGNVPPGKTHRFQIVPESIFEPWIQPFLWCQWIPGNKSGEPIPSIYPELDWDNNKKIIKPTDIPSEKYKEDNGKATTIVWDGCEKFYFYIEWLEYLIENFLKPWGYKLNGSVSWRGELFSDIGVITVENNKVTTRKGVLV